MGGFVFQGELEIITHKSQRIIRAVLKVKNSVHLELCMGGFGLSLGVDHGFIVVQWLTLHSRKLLESPCLCWFGLHWGRNPGPH